jgi:monoamine oxidase
MAGPPQMSRKIQFEPQLSRERRFIADRFIMAAFSKMVLVYDKRYWMEKGFSGEILSDCHDAPVLNAYDETRPNEKGELQPAIVVLLAACIEE